MLLTVTGTDGKTTVAHLARTLLQRLGRRTCTLGTLGVGRAGGWEPLPPGCGRPGSIGPTLRLLGVDASPDPVPSRHAICAIVEAPSAWLARGAFAGVRPTVGAITNVTRDHLDLHGSARDYEHAKLGLVRDLRPLAVVTASDSPVARAAGAWARRRGRPHLAVPTHDGPSTSGWVQVDSVQRSSNSQDGRTLQLIGLSTADRRWTISVTSPARHDVGNALTATAMCVAGGLPLTDVLSAAAAGPLALPPGRMERVCTTTRGATVWVDYAHTPAALEACLQALRPRVGRLLLVVGCGGDRDPGKRPLMGRIANRLADVVVVSDDNPRSEDPTTIRAALRRGCPAAHDVADRSAAVEEALSMAGRGDVVVLAGRGHERRQDGGPTLDDDATIARSLATTERILA